jgi:hypothetical protein
MIDPDDNRACMLWDGKRCKAELYGGIPSEGVCAACTQRLPPEAPIAPIEPKPASVATVPTVAKRPRRCGCGRGRR